MMADHEDLTLDTPWALGEETYSWLKSKLNKDEIKRILEFGSGVSTIRLALDFSDAAILSIDHAAQFARRTKRLSAKYSTDNISVFHWPISVYRNGGRFFLTYSILEGELPDEIDLVLIDGPVESRTERGREGVLYPVFPRIRSGGIIALDDYDRANAAMVVANWKAVYGNSLEVMATNSSMVILRKTGERRVDGRRQSAAMILENWEANLRAIFRVSRGKAADVKNKLMSWVGRGD